MFIGIRWRLISYYLVVIALIVILMGAFFIWFLNYFYMQTLSENLYIQARLVSLLVEEKLDRDAGSEDLDSIIKNLGEEFDLRLTLVNYDGTVLADSAQDPAFMENHGDRPEILEALRQGKGTATRHSVTLDKEMYYMAVPLGIAGIEGNNGKVTVIVRLALSLNDINQAVFSLKLFILGALFVAALAALVASVVFSDRITGPIKKISAAANSIAGGNFSPSLEVAGKDELADLAKNIKEMGIALNKKIEQVLWEKNKLETVVSSMSSGIILTDRDLKIELINPAAEELFDLSRDDVIGKSFNLAIRNYALNENLRAVTIDGETRVMEVNLYYPRPTVLDTYILPVHGTNHRIIGNLILFHDTTELRSIEKMRSDFVANVSHELRTPLTTVRGYTETIIHEELNREQLIDFLQVIDKETKRLSSLLDDLLDLAQIENEKGFIKKEQVDLKGLIGEALKRVEDVRKVQSAQITLNMPENVVYVSGNPEWLGQALVNILENSIKHGYEGVIVNVFMSVDGSHAEIKIKDNGPGIPEEDLPYVFERFYRVDKSRSRKAGSTGLGLSIVKHILEAHDASYDLSSKAGEGTTFTFKLSLSASQDLTSI
ncbi:MAG: ATP-binding protein [Bacillota bacterium]